MGSISARTLITTILITMMLGSALDCTDSDGGKNYYTQGHLIGEMAQPGGSTYHLDSFDACTDATRVSEYFCYVEGGVEYGLWETYNCANEGKFCENGVCVDPEPLPPCTDSDGGKDYYTQGHLVGEMEQPGGSTYHLDGFDTCTDATRVSEYFCYIEGGVEYGIWETYNCANEGKFCENGVCVDPEPLPPCTDSDGGKDYYTQGHLIGEMALPGCSSYHLDSFYACTDATRVSEYFCYLEGGIEYGIWETYNCANEGKICEEGKCVADPEAQDAELECTDRDGGKDYYVKGHLVGEMSQPGGSTYHLDGFDACTDATRVSEYFCYVEGGVEYGLWETYNCANEGKFCENGVCVDPEPLPPCTDSDGGKDYYTKGHLVGEMEQPGGSTYHLDGFDACTDATRVSEYFCYVEGGIEYGIWETYNCANEGKLCEEGVCVDPEPLPPCTDSDGGKDYYVKGHLVGEMEQPGGSTYHLDGFDACTDATRVSEYFCYVEGGVEYGIWETYNCADEGKVCEDGSCIPSVEDTPPCTDSDGGKDYYTKGNLIGEMEQPGGSTYHLDSSDACTDPTRLSEYFCYEEDGIQYGIWETYDCADEEKLCENGVCIEPDQEDEVQLCQDSDGGKDYYTKGHLVGEMAQPGGSTYHLDSFDACTDATRVSEYFCYLEGGIDYGIWETYNCADEGKSCEDGACVVPAPAEGTPPCADSDGGKDYYTKGHLVGEMEQPGGSTYHLDSSDACTDATRVSEYFCYVEGGIEYGIWETYDCANEGKACEDGVCVVPAPAEGTPPCTDSDGGKDYYTQGHLVGEMAQPGGSTYHLDSSDACTDATRVSEYFCYVEGGVEYGIWETHDCADEGKLCNDGVCVTDPAAQGGELECTDSDGGKDYYEKGNLVGEMAQPGGSTYHLDSSDACTDATRVSEYFCYVEGGVEYGIWETYDCANEGKACEDGACVAPAPAEGTPPCTDSDGGKDYYVKGQLVGEMEQPGGSTYHLDSSDACTDATRVSEYFCYVEGGVEYGIWETYDCANEGKACEDGACVAPAPAEGTPPCTDSDGGKDYYVKGQLVGEMEQPGGSTYHLDSSDACTDGTRVSEYFCYVEGGVDYGLWETYNCADEGKVCQDGQCVLSSDAGEAMGATEKEASTKPTSLDALILATIINYPDAIVSGAAAEKLGIPVLLTPPDALPDDVAAFITEEMPSKVILLGGTAVISQAIENKLKADGLDTVRLWGITRFGTAAELALYAWEAGTDGAIVVYDRIEGAEGDEHTQLVMAKSLAAARTQPILLTTNEELPAATKEALEELGVQKVTLVGTQFSEDVFTALKELDIELEVVTGETVEDVNDKLQEEVVDELTKNLPEGKLERLVVVAAGTDYKASISLPASAEVTASMMVLDVEQIPRVIEFIGEHGITEVTVVGIPELTSAVVAKLLMVEGIQVSALSTQAIEKGLVDRLKERRESWRNHREKRLVDRKVELIRKGDKLRERTERAVEKAQRVIDEIDAALTELKGQELPDELRVVIDMFEEELDRARQFVEEAGEITKGTTGRGRDFAEALRLLKKAEGVAREAKYKGMKMIAEFERRQMESLRRQKESEAERLRKERDAMAEELLGDMDIKENLRERILSKGDRLAEIRERVKEDRDRGPPGERRFGPSLEGREIGPRFDKDRFRKKDLSKRSFGKDLSLRGADPCK
ncbi:MAG: cell wall-binding repeat-containing protein, partial [Candidatus Undinarchaeales archaeon]|nr:cell wall-binding repeat-containing protein [Candidatus Undinarchaeales archaeon]